MNQQRSPSLLPSLRGELGDRADAVCVAGEPVSWATLSAMANGTAARLLGARAVAIDARPTLQTVIAVAAGLAAGVAVVPVPPDAGPVERSHIIRDSGAEAVVGAADWPDVALARIELATDGSLLAEPADDVAALIVYTSGTTGSPKGVVLSRRAVAAGLDGLAAAWQWTADDTLVHGLPLFHVHGLVLGVLGALRVGCRLVHTGKPTPAAYAAAQGSLYFGVPTVWGRVCAEPAAATALRSARLLVSGSAPLPVAVFEQLRALTGHHPVERYGMTETLITLSTRADGERRPGWVGLPIDGVRTRLVGDDGSAAARDGDTIGELHVAGSTLFDGYLGRPEATATAFDDQWFRTGDAAVIDADGFHRIVGRQSLDIIKTGGFKVGAGEVETALLSHPSVLEAAVVGAPDDDLGQRIVAYVVGSDIDAAALIEHVAATLSVHKRPRDVRVVDELPRNAMGKVQKGLLGR
ncbi:MAG: acyl-CoA synthetase [Ilumatobacteraceae bacterium]|nr:acyl-CoA synthetase [Acidimicrobiaceae bacterium]MBP6488828.1 acyl-CoA synthetase [Ilumatobacteraceae bacterium]MBP8209501.1 acyl-CoA synthetase [Ilumatobacteraceae bacterium]HQY14179.1 acyl-CoA synthetase [Ilumatobacteraceae bacterium]